MSSIIWEYIWTKFVLADKVFYKHLHLVISQLIDKIFQPLKEQKWCPSLGAPNFGVNSECFAQLLNLEQNSEFRSHLELCTPWRKSGQLLIYESWSVSSVKSGSQVDRRGGSDGVLECALSHLLLLLFL